MVILRTLRQSPAYLYAKAYCVCALVTLFQATPVSSTLPHIRQTVDLASRQVSSSIHSLTADPAGALREAIARGGDAREIVRLQRQLARLSHRGGREARLQKITTRWARRAWDLSQIKTLMKRDERDLNVYPELRLDAMVRCSPELHPDERRFIRRRQHRMSSRGDDSLRRLLGLGPGETVHPADAPLIALGGSGGGYRAMYGFSAFILAAKDTHLWDCITWTAGVSGSCWTLGAYYTIAGQDMNRLKSHYLAVAAERAHPMSMQALDMVARSNKGVYFLLAPLVRKAQNSIIGLGMMDLYATLTTSYQFLSREPGARLSRASFQFSKAWARSGIARGEEPLPLLTAVRRAPRHAPGVVPHMDSHISKGRPPKGSMAQHEAKHLQIGALAPVPESQTLDYNPKGLFQWFEISPLEIGCPDVRRSIPTWAWGRTFMSGRSVDRRPEPPLSLLLGQCTSAPAGPLTGYISALLATLPKGTAMSSALFMLNNFIRKKRWEKLWANPIRAGHDPNPFYGTLKGLRPADVEEGHDAVHGGAGAGSAEASGNGTMKLALSQSQALGFPQKRDERDAENDPFFDHEEIDIAPEQDTKPADENKEEEVWESQGRVRLMDGGMSNNLPNHILSRPERGADILLAFDASSDVQADSAIRRIHNFANDCRIALEEATHEFEPPARRYPNDGKASAESKVEEMHLNNYARVFRGTRETGEEMYLVYCPLLPNAGAPDFDPTIASFSTSYNLTWTPEQVETLFSLSASNFSQYSLHTIRQVVKRVYEARKRAREASEQASR